MRNDEESPNASMSMIPCSLECYRSFGLRISSLIPHSSFWFRHFLRMHYFITGTDTDAGKTYVTCLLLEALKRAGKRVAGFKPFVCGSQG
jgi:myo-inositol-1-phosphate synthase